MLTREEKEKIENYIDQRIDALKKETQEARRNGVSGEQLIETVTNTTVKKLTPEIPGLISSAYSLMKKHTLEEPFFADSSHQAAFYRKDILSQMTQGLVFEVPKEINYIKSQTEVKRLAASGAVVIVGGVVSITLKSWIPIGIAAIIAGIMALIIKGDSGTATNDGLDAEITVYYETVKKSLLNWIDSVEAFYDEAVEGIKRGISDG